MHGAAVCLGFKVSMRHPLPNKVCLINRENKLNKISFRKKRKKKKKKNSPLVCYVSNFDRLCNSRINKFRWRKLNTIPSWNCTPKGTYILGKMTNDRAKYKADNGKCYYKPLNLSPVVSSKPLVCMLIRLSFCTQGFAL